MADERDLQQKQQAYKQFRLTTHWPAMNIRLYDDASAVGMLSSQPDEAKWSIDE